MAELYFPDEPLSITRTLTFGCQLLKTTWRQLLPLNLLAVLLITIPFLYKPIEFLHVLIAFAARSEFFYDWLSLLLLLVVLTALYGAMYSLIIARITHHPQTITEALKVGIKRAPGLALAAIIYSIIVFFGLVLLVLPGIYAAVAFFFFMPLMILQRVGPFAVMANSIYLITPHWWRSAVFILITSLLNIGLNSISMSLFNSIVSPQTPLTSVYALIIIAGIISFFLTPWVFCLFVTHVLDLENRYVKQENITLEESEPEMSAS